MAWGWSSALMGETETPFCGWSQVEACTALALALHWQERCGWAVDPLPHGRNLMGSPTANSTDLPRHGRWTCWEGLPEHSPMSLQTLPGNSISRVRWLWLAQLSKQLSKDGVATPAPPSSLPRDSPFKSTLLCDKDYKVTSLHYLYFKKIQCYTSNQLGSITELRVCAEKEKSITLKCARRWLTA